MRPAFFNLKNKKTNRNEMKRHMTLFTFPHALYARAYDISMDILYYIGLQRSSVLYDLFPLRCTHL